MALQFFRNWGILGGVNFKGCCLLLGYAALGLFRAEAAHTQVEILLGAETARAGETVLAGVRLRMDPGWHTYWKNPGDSGMATRVDWELPPGVTIGDLQWPAPEKLPDPDLTTYIYTGEVVLLAPLNLALDLKPGPLRLKAKVSWLECEVQCLPGNAAVEASIGVGPLAKPSEAAPALLASARKMPQADTAIGARAWWEGPGTGDRRTVLIEWTPQKSALPADFYPNAGETFEVAPVTETVGTEPGKLRLRKVVKKLSGDWPDKLAGLIVQGGSAGRESFEVDLRLTPPKAAASAPAQSLWRMLLYAFIGGLILNVMPCVLPVIALKILGFVGQANDSPAKVRALGLIYAAGVVLSFLVLAGAVIVVHAAGRQAGWGMQFDNPYFLIGMTGLVTLIALNLFGVFEVQLGGRTMNAAASLSSGHGAAGAFFNGLLATILATSCTAPFLGAAVGFAFAQPPALILLIMGTVGLGLAAPYVILSWQPAWLRFLPRPGKWMERFKVAMGFPMLAAAVWLFSLASLHYGERSWWIAFFLVTVAVAAWVYGEFVQRQQARHGLALAATVAVLAGGYFGILENRLDWRNPITEQTSSGMQNDPNGIPWKPWSPAALAQAQAEGRPVLVDFTAKWCLTCNTIVKPALESASVHQRLRELNAVALLADYTHFPTNITEELSRHGRAGVPLVLVYGANPEEPPIILPEALTSSTILNALDRLPKARGSAAKP